MKKPVYQIARELSEEYKKRGIKYVYNTSNRNVYLSVLAAPMFVPETPETEEQGHVQMVGYLVIEGGEKISAVERTKNIDEMVDKVKKQYAMQWNDNKLLMSYLDTVH